MFIDLWITNGVFLILSFFIASINNLFPVHI